MIVLAIDVLALIIVFALGLLSRGLRRKPGPDWKAIASNMHLILIDPEEDSAIYCCKKAIRVYEEAVNERK